MKKLMAAFLAIMMVLSLAACSGGDTPSQKPSGNSDANNPTADANKGSQTDGSQTSEADPGKLVIYTAADQSEIDLYMSEFEEQTGIKVEIVSAGTGELLKRIEAESEKPLADVQCGGGPSVVLPYAEYFEPYTCANEDSQLDSCKNVDGVITGYNMLPLCMVVNTNLIGDIEINGYEDLLQPELKGKIALMDPAQSATGYQHLTNMLTVMGGGDEEKGWEFVEQFVDNLDGKLIPSSSGVGKGVADGEYIVGLTHEGYATDLANDGYPIKAVYPEEGVVVVTSTLQIIKGCNNLENAKKFLDFITSKEIQTAAAETLHARGTNKEAPAPEGLPDISEMNVIVEDVHHSMEHSQEYLDRFKDIYTG